MKKKILSGMVLVCSMLLASVIIIEGLIISAGNQVDTDQEVDYLIVLGAGLYWDTISPSLHERLKVAEEYLQEHKDMKVIVSGGQGPDEKFSEAYAMSHYLIDQGIDSQRIILEDQSSNTFQNLSFSLEKIREIDKTQNPRVLIASNKYHLFRSKILAKRLGMEPYGLPGKIPPSIVFKSYTREYFAVIKSLLFDKV